MFEPTTGEFTSKDPLEYVDGMSLYRGYFVPNGVDPNGEKTSVYQARGGIWFWFPERLTWELDAKEKDKIASLNQSAQMISTLIEICDDDNIIKQLRSQKDLIEQYINDIVAWNPESRWLGRPANGVTITFPFTEYETGKRPLTKVFLDGVAAGCAVGLSEGTAIGGLATTPWEILKKNPRFIYGRSADEMARLLGPKWIKSPYGKTGTGWKFIHKTHNDRMIFFNSGGRHGGSYWGISGAAERVLKLAGPGYRPDPSDKAKIICCTCKKIAEMFLK